MNHFSWKVNCISDKDEILFSTIIQGLHKYLMRWETVHDILNGKRFKNYR